MNPLHSNRSAEWWTPRDYADAAHEVMGGIDLDPFSCAEANQVIRALLYFDKSDDGLAHPWSGNVFVNPPGGVTEKVKDPVTGREKRVRIEPSLVRPAWERLVRETEAGNVMQAIWIGYSLEQLQTLQSSPRCPLDYSICFPAARIPFDSDQGKSTGPTHANYVSFLLSERHPLGHAAAKRRFLQAFSRFGKVRTI